MDYVLGHYLHRNLPQDYQRVGAYQCDNQRRDNHIHEAEN